MIPRKTSTNPTLFSARQMKQCKTKKVWTSDDRFPFGVWKGQLLSRVAALNPEYLEWWAFSKKIILSAELKGAIQLAKFLNK